MESSNKFDLDIALKKWQDELESSPTFTNADIEELKLHLLDIYYELQATELSKEEAFLVAITRIGKPVDWESEFSKSNELILRLKKTVSVLSGIFFYFFSYYFIKLVLSMTLIVGVLLGNEAVEAVRICKVVAISILFVVLLNILITLSSKGDIFIKHISTSEFKLKHITRIFIATLFFAIANHCTRPFIVNLIPSARTRYLFIELNDYFDYSFPFLITLGFIVLYFKVFKKSELPERR